MMLTGPRTISSIATQSVLLSRHATIWINPWTRAFTSCKVVFDVDQLLDWSRTIIWLRYIYCLSILMKYLPFRIPSLPLFCFWKAVVKLLVAFARKILISFGTIVMVMRSNTFFVKHDNRLPRAIYVMKIFQSPFKIGRMSCHVQYLNLFSCWPDLWPWSND